MVSAVAPVPFWIMPLKVVDVLFPPEVSVAAAPELVTIPAPASEPIEFENPARSSVAPLSTVVAEDEPNADVEPALKVPALTVVEDVVAPTLLNTAVPAPVFAMLPVLEIGTETLSVSPEATLNVMTEGDAELIPEAFELITVLAAPPLVTKVRFPNRALPPDVVEPSKSTVPPPTLLNVMVFAPLEPAISIRDGEVNLSVEAPLTKKPDVDSPFVVLR